MIFTHIFRYLDDRDAEEIRRRGSDNSDNSRSPVADSRCQEFSAEHRDVKFGQNTWKGAASLVPGGTQTSARSKTLFSAPLSQGFSTLRAETRTAPKTTTANRVLPPIGKSQMVGGEKQLVAYDKNTTKLPPIDPLTSKARPATRKPRSCSRKNEEAFWKNTTSTEQSPLEDQRRSRTPNDRTAPLSTDGQVKETIHVTEEMTDCLKMESNTDNRQKERRRTQLASFDDMSLAKAGIKKTFYQQNAKKLESKTTKVVESTQADAINAEKTSNYLISRQFETHKGFSNGAETREEDGKPKTGELYKRLGISEYNAQAPRLSVEPNMEAVKARSNSSPCIPSAEYLRLQIHEASSNHACGSLVTDGKTETKVRLVTCDKGRRNAICEVLEKNIVPEYGSSLYEMRQNLMSMS